MRDTLKDRRQLRREGTHRQRLSRWFGLATLLPLLALAACGGTTRTNALRPRSGPLPSPTPGGQATPPWVPYPTPIPPPYAFPKTWQTPASAPHAVTPFDGVAFAPSSPRDGYAYNMPPPGQASASPLYVTHDGGMTWQSLGQHPFPVSGGYSSLFVNPANAQDIFVEQQQSVPEGGVSYSAIWRSLDGGATWRALPSVPEIAAGPTTVSSIGVLGTRIVVTLGLQTEGTLLNALYASDDGGATWQQFAASLPPQVTSMVILGDSVIVQTIPPAPAAADSRSAALGGVPRLAPASSGGPAPVYFRSDNDGATWSKISVPGGLPVFTLAASGNSYYGVSVAPPQSAGAPVIAYWSADSGATWKALPTLQGVENGWLDPLSLGQFLVVGTDGSVLTYTQHLIGPTPSSGQSDAGLFVLNALSNAPAWQPLTTSTENQLQVIPTTNGVRVWTVQNSANGSGAGTPVYVDLP